MRKSKKDTKYFEGRKALFTGELLDKKVIDGPCVICGNLYAPNKVSIKLRDGDIYTVDCKKIRFKSSFEFEFDQNGEFDFHSIPESICLMMCDEHDAGQRWSKDSRYTYSFNSYEKNKSEIRFGTAKACIQSYIKENHSIYERFNIYSVTPNGSKLKNRVLKEK